MRLLNLILWDIRFQIKYGFYFLYTVLTILYVILISTFPETWCEKAAVILIFSDPAAMGLFFMGAIVLLEKNQHSPYAFAVSPVLTSEYVIAKVISLSIISVIVATVLSLSARVNNLPLVLLGTFFSSVICTLLGIMVAAHITSLNQFVIWTVPIEILVFVPAILHLFDITPHWMSCWPADVCIDMVAGHVPSVAGSIITLVLIFALFSRTKVLVIKMWRSTGDVKV